MGLASLDVRSFLYGLIQNYYHDMTIIVSITIAMLKVRFYGCVFVYTFR